MAGRSSIKNLVVGVALSLASITLCLIVIECALGLRHERALARIESARNGAELCTAPSAIPELIYTGLPGKCEMNSQGYRDHEYSFRKEPGVFRVVVIGDSVAAGMGVDVEEGFAKLLEQGLNRLPGRSWRRAEVVILARNGYSTSQQLYLLEHEAFRYAPDLVVWSYVLNDPAHPVYHDANGQIGLYHFHPTLHTASFLREKLFLIREKLRWRNCARGEYHALLQCAYGEEIRSAIGRIAVLAAERGVPVIFVIHPVFEQAADFSRYTLTPVHAELAGFASAAGLPVLDLLDAYGTYSPGELAQATADGIDPWHPNRLGHQVSAQALLDRLRQTPGLLPAP